MKKYSGIEIKYLRLKSHLRYIFNGRSAPKIIRTTNIEDLSKDLRLNWSSCREKAFVILITNLVSLSFLIILLIYLVYIYKNRKEREDISDLLTILKRMNRK